MLDKFIYLLKKKRKMYVRDMSALIVCHFAHIIVSSLCLICEKFPAQSPHLFYRPIVF